MSLRHIIFTVEKERKEEEKKKRIRRKKKEEKKNKSRFGSMEFMFGTSLLFGTPVYVGMEPMYGFVG